MRKIAKAIHEDEMDEIVIIVRREIMNTHTPRVRGVVMAAREIERARVVRGIRFNIMVVVFRGCLWLINIL